MEKIMETREKTLNSLFTMLKGLSYEWCFKWASELGSVIFADNEAHMPQDTFKVVSTNEEWFDTALDLYNDYVQLAIGHIEVRYFPCFTIKDGCLSDVTGFFDADDSSYFNENDRGIVVDSEKALYFYDKITEQERHAVEVLFSILQDNIAANPDDSIEVSDLHFEKRVSYVKIERLEV